MRGAWRAALTALVVLAADQGTKALVRSGVERGDSDSVFIGIKLVNTRNDGIAFGLFSGAGGGWIVAVATGIALAVLLGWFAVYRDRPYAWLPTGLLLGGAAGNVIDRIRDGAVTDFIDLPLWPPFNLADAAITIGILSLLVVADLTRATTSPMKKLLIAPEQAGERLDQALADLLGSRAAAQRAIEAGAVTVDGVARAKSHRVSGGEEIAVAELAAEGEPEPPAASYEIAYEDEHLLVIDKPPGVVVHPAAGHRRGTLVQALGDRVAGGSDPERPGVVHRLDRDTSGLLVLARSDAAHAALSRQLREREITREYLALVDGRPPARTGTIDAPLGRDRRRRTRVSTDTDEPREAITHFAIERALPASTLLRVRLETGRTHQIRAHFEAIGHPVLGDPEYGSGPGEHGLARQFLHAARLAFAHPVRPGERVDVAAPLPDDLARALRRASADE